jgi:NADPH2:quinone reductase
VLARLGDLGADATIQLDQSAELLRDTYVSEMGEAGFDVILDYLWGEPTEALLGVLSKKEFAAATRETRLVQVGESAAAKITLPAAVLAERR